MNSLFCNKKQKFQEKVKHMHLSCVQREQNSKPHWRYIHSLGIIKLAFALACLLSLISVCSTDGDSSGSAYGHGQLSCLVALMSQAALQALLRSTPTSTTVTMTTPAGCYHDNTVRLLLQSKLVTTSLNQEQNSAGSMLSGKAILWGAFILTSALISAKLYPWSWEHVQYSSILVLFLSSLKLATSVMELHDM